MSTDPPQVLIALSLVDTVHGLEPGTAEREFWLHATGCLKPGQSIALSRASYLALAEDLAVTPDEVLMYAFDNPAKAREAERLSGQGFRRARWQ